MNIQQIQEALEEAFNSLEEADGELLQQILEGGKFVDYEDVGHALFSIEQILYAVRRASEKVQTPQAQRA